MAEHIYTEINIIQAMRECKDVKDFDEDQHEI
jgi:hypothetical protein